MPDTLDLLRGADPAAAVAGRSSLDERARQELAALGSSDADEAVAAEGAGASGRISDGSDGGDELMAQRVRRRRLLPAAAAAATALVLAGSLGLAHFVGTGETGGFAGHGVAGTDGDKKHKDVASSQARMQATLDGYRAVRGKAQRPYLLGVAAADRSELVVDAQHDETVAASARAGRFAPAEADGDGAWAARWGEFVSATKPLCPSCPGEPVAGVAATPSRYVVRTAVGPVEVGAYDVALGAADSGVRIRILDVPRDSFVDLDSATRGRPVFATGIHRDGDRELRPYVIEDEAATRGEYAVDVLEADEAVVLSVRTLKESTTEGQAPSDGLMRRMREVRLPAVALKTPLGARPVLDAATGAYVAFQDAAR